MDFTKLPIEELSSEQLLESTIQTIFATGPVNEKKTDRLELANQMRNADFDIIKCSIKYERKDGEFNIELPFLNQRRDPHFQEGLFIKTLDMIPVVGHFVQCDSEVVKRPLGLVEIVHRGFNFAPNPSDLRFPKYERQYENRDYFYFDYEKKEYVGVIPEELEQAKWRLAKDMEDGPDLKKEVEEYLLREEVLLKIEKKVIPLGITYQKKLREFYKMKHYNTIASIERYLKIYKEFLESHMILGLKLHLFFSTIKFSEYERLKKEADRLEVQLQEVENLLEKLKSSIQDQYEKFESMNILELHIDSAEGTISKLLVNKISQELDTFKTIRDDGRKEGDFTGYIGYSSDLMEVYPNIAQFEKRHYFRETNGEQHSYYKQKEAEDKLLKLYQKKQGE
ncbi:hypothetical protein EXW58_29265 (plasmid) [Bacillus mycoides]|uniref:hypothetical protein n=1 Tax=Bacillus mycoides TaxID=1405 RepID=UPI001C03603E|nr:hypothetical protein [Bacillus mycoides]QWG31471.1 hypothetical protein EXW58_29265 [Bacillus mycoides]